MKSTAAFFVAALFLFAGCSLLVFFFKLNHGKDSVDRSRRQGAGPVKDELAVLSDAYAKAERDYTLKMAKNVKIGIVAMITCSQDLEFWLAYHLSYLDIDLLVLGVEECMGVKPILTKYGSKIDAVFYNRKDINITDNYHSMMPRQNNTVSRGIELASKRGVSFLFHIDADELLYVGPAPNLPISNMSEPLSTVGVPRSALLRKHLMEVEPVYSNIHLHNFEAVYPKINRDDPSQCFNTDRFLDCNYMGKCKNYANGKSAGRIGSEGFGHWLGGLKFHGPHHFSGRSFQMPNHRLAVLHFDSCTFTAYLQKFRLLAKASEERIKQIPFAFYKNTIRQLHKCMHIPLQQGSDERRQQCEAKLEVIYSRYRVQPYNTWRARQLTYFHD